MDEVLFRSSQKIENLQVRVSVIAEQSKDLLYQYSIQSKAIISQGWNSTYPTQIRHNIRELWQLLLHFGIQAKERAVIYVNPQQIYYKLMKIFWEKWSKRDICCLAAGFMCGAFVGYIFAFSSHKSEFIVRQMQAVQCTNYLGIESATVMGNAIAPSHCGENEVIVSVKAASVQVVDAQICSGYGKVLRKILQRIYKQSKNDLPVTLGRDCSGMVIDAGPNVNRLEIGDAVWLTVPFWSQGTISDSVLVPESRVGRKPKNVGFEGACSLPYSGSIALNVLKEIKIDDKSAQHKRILVIGGCTPAGCILIQLLKHWGANVTATCYKRAVPVAKALGAADIMICPDPIKNDGKTFYEFDQEAQKAFLKELELRDRFDHIILTRDCGLAIKDLKKLCYGKIASTLPEACISDTCGFFGGLFVGAYIRLKYVLEKLLGVPLNCYDEGHMCYVTLDELMDLVESGQVQTVVDKVFHPQDIEIALNHIQSHESIGSTVITFR